jgi:gliding motility-associated-like protein
MKTCLHASPKTIFSAMPTYSCFRRYWLLLLLTLPLLSWGQTELYPGDLAVLGVNSNLSGCGEGNFDLVSFVCFKDIEPNTLIDITDNGWERANPSLWGNSEGFITVRRTGAVIPAGTVITFRLPSIGTAYQAVAPDGEWEFTQLTINALNLNSDGDQLYFLQGGEWDNGNAVVGNFSHDASYEGGLILFAFNTKTEWNALANTSQDSGLHPDVADCFNMAPTGGVANFTSYQGPLSPAGQIEWIARIADSDNWQAYPACPEYLPPPSFLEIQEILIDIACSVCRGCDNIAETLRFALPATGGPFTVVYSDGFDDFIAENLSDGAAIDIQLDKSAEFRIRSITTSAGCPFFPNLGDGVEILVAIAPDAQTPPALIACDDGQGLFDLTLAEATIDLTGAFQVRWFLDDAGNSPIDNPDAFLSGPGNVFAFVVNEECASEPVVAALELAANPEVVIVLESQPSCAGLANGRVRVEVAGGQAPFLFTWSDNRIGGDNPDNLLAGPYEVTVSDRHGCEGVASVVLADPEVMMIVCAQRSPASQADNADGVAELSIDGGTPPYSIRWLGPVDGENDMVNSANFTIENLLPGLYQVEVSDNGGCRMSCAFTIGSPDCDISLSFNKTDVSCPGVNDGAINLSINGGAAPYDIEWNDDRFGGQLELRDLPPGEYAVRVADSEGCLAASSIIVNATFPRIGAFVGPGGVLCDEECYDFILEFTGTSPFVLEYEINGQSRVFNTAETMPFLTLCDNEFPPAAGPVDVRFVALRDANCRLELDQNEIINRLAPAQSAIDTVLCAGENLEINGVIFDADNPAGAIVLPSAAVNGCDSTVLVSIRFQERAEGLFDTVLCVGQSFVVRGVVFDEDNPEGSVALPGANGCDSLLIVRLRFVRDTLVELRQTLCRGQSITVNGNVYDEANPNGVERFDHPGGCDSTVVVNLTFLDEVTSTIDTVLCAGEQLLVNGVVYDENRRQGREVFAAAAAGGCDSVVVVRLAFAGGESRIDSTLCLGESLSVNGVVFDQNNPSGSVPLSANELACDSTVIVNLTFIEPPRGIIDSVLCAGERLIVNGTVYDEENPSGVEIIAGAGGCEEIIEIELRFVPAVTAALEGDRSICAGESAELTFRLFGAAQADVQYSDGSGEPVRLISISDGHTIQVSPAATTTYAIDFVLISGAACPAGIGQTATIDVNTPTVDIQSVHNFGGYGLRCAGDSNGALRASVSGATPPLAPSWNTGATTLEIDGLSAGEYEIVVTDAAGCEARASFLLNEPKTLEWLLSLIDPSCPDDRDGAVVIEGVQGGAPPYFVALNDADFRAIGDLPAFVRDMGVGEFRLRLRDANGCELEERGALDGAADLFVDLGADTVIRRGDSLQLNPRLNFQADSLVWSPSGGLSNPNMLNPVARPQVTTTYQLTAYSAEGCRLSDRILIVVENRSRLYAPNAFSPNGDGVNDFFSIYARGDEVAEIAMRVFDRWGALVFFKEGMQANAELDGWNGMIRGRAAAPGVYVFVAEITFQDGSKEIAKGEVTLLR